MELNLVRDPIYQQLNQALRTLIFNGEIKPGSKFLTEREICKLFDVSRTTANKALSNLVSEGILEFKKGVGTFLRDGLLDYDLRALVSFTEKAIAAKKEPSTRVIQFKKLRLNEIDDDICDKLRVTENDELYYMERIRMADNVPVILERRYVVAEYCPDMKKEDVSKSLYSLWTDKYKLDISVADQIIRVINLSDKEAELFEVKKGVASFVVISTGYLINNIPLWWERTLYRGDLYEFHNQLDKIKKVRPAAGILRNIEE